MPLDIKSYAISIIELIYNINSSRTLPFLLSILSHFFFQLMNLNIYINFELNTKLSTHVLLYLNFCLLLFKIEMNNNNKKTPVNFGSFILCAKLKKNIHICTNVNVL